MKKRPTPRDWKLDDEKWDELFANSQDVLAKMADEAELWYARELAASMAEGYVKRLRAKVKK